MGEGGNGAEYYWPLAGCNKARYGWMQQSSRILYAQRRWGFVLYLMVCRPGGLNVHYDLVYTAGCFAHHQMLPIRRDCARKR